MSSVRLIYIALQLLCMLIMFLSAFPISRTKTDRDYWKWSLCPIITFSFVHGLRFAREQDYVGYFFHFTLMKNGNNPEEYEYIFYKICHIFGLLGLPFWILVLCTAILFISSVMFVLKDFKKALPFVFLFLFWEIRYFDYWMRFFIAFPFLLYSFGFLFRRKYLYALLFSIIAINVHIGMVLLLPFVVFYKFIEKVNFSPKIVSFLFIIVLLLGSTAWLTELTGYLSFLNLLGIDRVDYYTSSADDLLEGTFRSGFFNSRTLINNIRLIMAYLPGLLIGKEILLEYYRDKLGNYVYNLFAIGAICYGIFTTVEILDRFESVLMFFSAIVNGFMVRYILLHREYINPIVKYCCFIAIFAAVWPNISGLNNRPKDDYMLFIWDANGRDYIISNTVPMTGGK